jgi:hypothetical protein
LREVASAHIGPGGTSFDALTGSPVTIADTFGSFMIAMPAQASRKALIYITGGAYRTASVNLVFACWNDLAGGTGCNAASDAPGSNATSPCKTRIWFARSLDGGQTWQTPQRRARRNRKWANRVRTIVVLAKPCGLFDPDGHECATLATY